MIRNIEITIHNDLEIRCCGETELEKEIDKLFQLRNAFSNTNKLIDNFKLIKPICIVEKGKQGELIVKDILNNFVKYNVNTKLIDVSKISHSGDLFLTHKNLNCVIEVKNYKMNIGLKELDKFIVDVNNSKYNCGIFISLSSEFNDNTNIEDLTIKFINNKPVIYIANLCENYDKLTLSINLLTNIINLLNVNEQELENYINKFKLIYTDITNLTNNITDIEKLITNSKKILQNSKYTLNELLHIEESTEVITKCNKSYKNIKSIAYQKHISTCLICKF